MWGGCTGIFHNIEAHIRDYVATGRYLDNRVMDQHYLRYCIWPTLKQSVLYTIVSNSIQMLSIFQLMIWR